jgi:hypothetical protein
VVRGSPFLSSTQRKLFVERAAIHRFPTMYEMRDFIELGGLASYGTDSVTPSALPMRTMV